MEQNQMFKSRLESVVAEWVDMINESNDLIYLMENDGWELVSITNPVLKNNDNDKFWHMALLFKKSALGLK